MTILGPEFGTQESLVRIQSPDQFPVRITSLPGPYNGHASQAAAQVRYCSMSKLLFLVIAIIVVYFVVKGLKGKRRERAAPPPPGETMVPCARCGVNLPRSEALEAAGGFFCSEEHRRLGAG